MVRPSLTWVLWTLLLPLLSSVPQDLFIWVFIFYFSCPFTVFHSLQWMLCSNQLSLSAYQIMLQWLKLDGLWIFSRCGRVLMSWYVTVPLLQQRMWSGRELLLLLGFLDSLLSITLSESPHNLWVIICNGNKPKNFSQDLSQRRLVQTATSGDYLRKLRRLHQ